MPARSKKQWRWMFANKKPFAHRWAHMRGYEGLPASKDAGAAAGASLHGPGGLLSTPGLGKRQPKWRTKATSPCESCALRMKDGEFGQGITRIRGNLCNVHGKYGACPGGGGAAASGPKLSNQPKQTAPKPSAAPKGGKKGGGGKGAKGPSAEQQARQAKRDQEHEQDRAQRAQDRDARLARQQQRDAERLAKQNAPKPEKEPKGGGGGKAKPSDEEKQRQREQARQEAEQKKLQAQSAEQAKNRGQVRQQLASQLDGASFDSLMAFDAGGTLSPEQAAPLAKLGLVTQDATGGYRMSAEGERLVKAANAGDTRGAADAISAAADRLASEGQRTTARQQRQAEQQRRRTETDQRRAATDARVAQNRAEAAARRAENDRRRAESDARARAAAARAAARRETQDSKRKSWTVTTKASSPGDYLVVEDPAKPSTYHLQVRRNGTPDHRLMGAAWAALHGGYRGNTYQGPDKAKALDKLKALYRAEKMELPSEKSFAVFKDHAGAYRWIARTTTAYRDRDGEIISTKALEADAARMTATGMYGPLRYWHVGEPDPFDPVAPWGPGLDIGDCDYSIVIGRTSIESGTFKSAAIGRAFAESAAEYELSPGFFHPLDQPDAGGVFVDIRRFERSAVPIKYGRASNLFTGLTVKERRMDQQTYDARVKAYLEDMHGKGVPPEVAAQSLAGMEQADKSAAAQGIAFKSDDAPAVPDEITINGVVYTAKAAAPPPMAEAEPPAVETQADDLLVEDEPPLDDEGVDVIGNLTRDEFKALILEILAEGQAPMMKAIDVAGKMAGYVDEMKSMFGSVATKDDARAAELTALKAQQQELAAKIAEIEGRQPATILPDEVEAALKSAGPQQPEAPETTKVESTPERPWAGWGALTFPELYGQSPSQS